MTDPISHSSEWDFPNPATPLGSPPYYAVRFSAPERHRLYALLFAWRDLIVAIGHNPQDPGVARLKLDWWREEIGAITDSRPRHPLAEALQDAGLGEPALTPMHGLIDAVERAVVRDGLADDGEFARACRDEGGSFFLLLEALEQDAGYGPERCVALGAYCNAVERLRLSAVRPDRVPRDLARLPDDDPQGARRRERCDALCRYPGERHSLPNEPVPAICRRLVALQRGLHGKLIRKGYPFGHTLIDRAPIAHLWTAWRCR
jgi:phytoene synthase